MFNRFQLIFLVFLFLPGSPFTTSANEILHKIEPIEIGTSDWPWWRGPNRNGIAMADQTVPMKWDQEHHVLWKSPIPGKGHSSPTVVGQRIFLATANSEQQTQSVLCLDRATGKHLWKMPIHQGGLESIGKQPNSKSSRASSTVACDGQRLFINFRNRQAIYTTALDLNGNRLWQTKITDYVLHQGYGSSPAIHGPLVIVSADNKGGGVVMGLERTTGKVVWKQERPQLPNYPSPIILPIAGRDQVLMVGCDLVAGFDPLTGSKIWESPGATTECVTSTVSDGNLMVTSGGYPKNHIAVMRADGSGEILWHNNTRVYVPSLLIHDAHLYAVTDAGIAICHELLTGKLAWKHRLDSTFTSSPVLVGEHIHVTGDEGKTYIFAANPKTFTLLAENRIAGRVIATPAICGNRIYMRITREADGKRQDMLYCLGHPGSY
jgi:outer membrane protein assembly factor BamB